MHTGHRLKMLRMSDGLTQKYLAELLRVSQNTITKLESGKIRLAGEKLDTISNYFIVSQNWLAAGIPPMIKEGWGYSSIPSNHWEDQPRTEQTKTLNQLEKTMKTIFPDFLIESKIKKYYRANIEDSLDAFFVFPLSSKSSLVIRVRHFLWSAMEEVLESAGVRLGKAIDVPKDLADYIHQSSSPASRLKSTVELHRLLGIAQITKTWKELAKTKQPRCLEAYQNRVMKVCKDILAKDLDPLDIIRTLKNLAEARLNYTFEDSVDYLLNRRKAPLLKSHADKLKDEDFSH